MPEQAVKNRQRQDDGQAVEQLPDEVNEQSAKVSEDADELLAELDELLKENAEVAEDAAAAQEDFLSRWDDQAALIDKQRNPDWQEQDNENAFSFCGC